MTAEAVDARTDRTDHTDVVDVVHYGLGPIGLAVAGLALQRRSLRSVSAVDVNPELRDRDLGTLCGAAPTGVAVTTEPQPSAGGRAVAVHCTGSSLAKVAPQLRDLVRRGYWVVSTCEELSYPWDEAPDIAAELDSAARQSGVAIVGTGVNPGFAMDYLPLALTGVLPSVDAVRVHRVQNASARRIPLQQKVGAGLTTDAFAELRAQGAIGHAGLRQSVQAIAAGLGWRLDQVVETLEPAIAAHRIEAAIGVVEAGQVTGIDQTAVGLVDGREAIRLRLEMALDRADARDVVNIDGPDPIELSIAGGLHGDTATAAIVVNTIPRILRAPVGLRTMAELPPPRAATADLLRA